MRCRKIIRHGGGGGRRDELAGDEHLPNVLPGVAAVELVVVPEAGSNHASAVHSLENVGVQAAAVGGVGVDLEVVPVLDGGAGAALDRGAGVRAEVGPLAVDQNRVRPGALHTAEHHHVDKRRLGGVHRVHERLGDDAGAGAAGENDIAFLDVLDGLSRGTRQLNSRDGSNSTYDNHNNKLNGCRRGFIRLHHGDNMIKKTQSGSV